VQTPEDAEVAISQMNVLTYELIEELNQTKKALALKKGIEPEFE
jgi:hypothetical protein